MTLQFSSITPRARDGECPNVRREQLCRNWNCEHFEQALAAILISTTSFLIIYISCAVINIYSSLKTATIYRMSKLQEGFYKAVNNFYEFLTVVFKCESQSWQSNNFFNKGWKWKNHHQRWDGKRVHHDGGIRRLR